MTRSHEHETDPAQYQQAPLAEALRAMAKALGYSIPASELSLADVVWETGGGRIVQFHFDPKEVRIASGKGEAAPTAWGSMAYPVLEDRIGQWVENHPAPGAAIRAAFTSERDSSTLVQPQVSSSKTTPAYKDRRYKIVRKKRN